MMNEIVHTFLIARDTLMPEMYSKHPGFTKNKERIQEFKETATTRLLDQIELEKACFSTT